MIPSSHFVQDYYSLMPVTLFTKDNSVIYGFEHCDTLFRYNILTSKIDNINLVSQYFTKNEPFDYNKISDFAYVHNYSVNQSRYGLIFAPPNQKILYRFLKHGINPVEEDGKINEYYDAPLSILVVSLDLKKQKEYYVAPNLFSKIQLSFCSNDYIYVPADESKQTFKGQTLYYKLKFGF